MRDYPELQEDTGGLEHNLESEIIANLLTFNDLIGKWNIKPEYFQEPIWQEAYEIIHQHWAEGKDCTLPVFRNLATLETRKFLGSALVRQCRPASQLDEILRAEYQRRMIFDACSQGMAMAENAADVSEISDYLRGWCEQAENESGSDDTANDLYAINKQIIENIQNGVKPEILPTGSSDLTKALAGYRRGELIIMAGRPSMGKSMVAQSLGLKIAQQGHGVLFFALEMTAEEIGYRALSGMSYSRDCAVPYRDIKLHSLTDRQQRRITQAATRYTKIPFSVDDKAGRTVSQIGTQIRRHKAKLQKQEQSLDVVIVDHMGHVTPSDRYRGNKVQEVGETSAALLALAKDLDVAIIAVCQLNRNSESRDNKRPCLSDLRNSGDIEQDAHAVVFVYRDAYYLERMPDVPEDTLAAVRNKIELIIAKSRNGPTDTLHMFCEPACNVVRDLQC